MSVEATSRYPRRVKIVEVAPRDGLQNESSRLDTDTKVEFINRLSETGLRSIEVTSFVKPSAVPQHSDAEQVFSRIRRQRGICYPALVPNLQGLQRAISVGVQEIAIFSAASETFCHNNIHCGIEESFKRFDAVIERAQRAGMRIRGYVSCALGCPYEGQIRPETIATLAKRFYELGCYEISLGDTIGIGTPLRARQMLESCAALVPISQLALHFHDTRGQALANIFACLGLGAEIIDASVAGLGGCPYAKGATGNVATEDVVYMLQGMGIETGIDLVKLIDAGWFICARLGCDNRSRVASALSM
jgi:hydroxymethylglutaryl-CoA lyase